MKCKSHSSIRVSRRRSNGSMRLLEKIFIAIYVARVQSDTLTLSHGRIDFRESTSIREGTQM